VEAWLALPTGPSCWARTSPFLKRASAVQPGATRAAWTPWSARASRSFL